MEEKITFKLFSDVGMGELFMSRLIHFQDHILSGLFGGKNKEDVQQAIMKVLFDGLEPAFRSLRSLRSKWHDDKIPEREKIQLVESVYTYLVIAFKDRFQDVAKKMGFEIGFLFQTQELFEKGLQNFNIKYPKIDPVFIDTIREDRVWSDLMVSVRNNVIDHQAGKNPVIISRLSSFLNVDTVEVLFENCWKTIEDFLVIFADALTDPKYGMKILELQIYKQNKNNSERFGWFDVSERKENLAAKGKM